MSNNVLAVSLKQLALLVGSSFRAYTAQVVLFPQFRGSTVGHTYCHVRNGIYHLLMVSKSPNIQQNIPLLLVSSCHGILLTQASCLALSSQKLFAQTFPVTPFSALPLTTAPVRTPFFPVLHFIIPYSGLRYSIMDLAASLLN